MKLMDKSDPASLYFYSIVCSSDYAVNHNITFVVCGRRKRLFVLSGGKYLGLRGWH